MAIKADEVQHPDDIQDEFDWSAAAEGERPDTATRKTLNIAHRAVQKFPELKGKYKAYAGAAAIVSSALTVVAGIAIARKMKGGMSADKALAALTAADFEAALHDSSRRQRYGRMLRKMRLRGRGQKKPQG